MMSSVFPSGLKQVILALALCWVKVVILLLSGRIISAFLAVNCIVLLEEYQKKLQLSIMTCGIM